MFQIYKHFHFTALTQTYNFKSNTNIIIIYIIYDKLILCFSSQLDVYFST